MRAAQGQQQVQNPVTHITTNLRRMRTSLLDGVAQYLLPLYDVLAHTGTCDMNLLVGGTMVLHFAHAIHCIESGKSMTGAWPRSVMTIVEIYWSCSKIAMIAGP